MPPCGPLYFSLPSWAHHLAVSRIHKHNKYLLSTSSVSGTVLYAEEPVVNKMDNVSLLLESTV